MQEKKNKRLALMLLILTIITVVVYGWNTKEKVQVDKNIFRLADYKTVDRVVLTSARGKVELVFNGARWKVNGQYDADRNLISLLFATLQQAEPKRPVPAYQQDSINALMEKTGVEVFLYSGQKTEQRFLAGGNSLKTQAYFKELSGNGIYLVNIPGYRVYVSGILELTESEWRDKQVFGFNWRNFQSLQAEFPDKPSENFKVSMQNGLFSVDDIPRTDTTKLSAFLENVYQLAVNEYLEPGTFTDSLLTLKPLMVLTVADIGKRQYSLKIFREKGSQILGLLDEKQGVVFNRLKIQPILRPKSFFRTQ